jgi:hypothetical protein
MDDRTEFIILFLSRLTKKLKGAKMEAENKNRHLAVF